ncbi:molybdopterin dinucleotide-binding protein [Gordonibacter sp. An230]|uniref:molybdopterin-containing oxidoreductase family protein n=1 Tax=Gordonibacter sp. An230 TaxID=1965592 RepID=UPI000B38A2E9|nr:molybdopterin dinucleotide binding domain-containing protein [Gordonibacter sp. An230]OUO89866.1 molybdopterin dinucleotide-binding protein [Gordonibacter sp. An230]
MGKLMLSRRSFAKAAAVTMAAAGVSGTANIGAALAEQSADGGAGEVKRIRSCCRGCGKMECGVWVTVRDGRVIKTEGDESAFQSAGNHCAKGQASLQAAYHPDRLLYPLKRTNPKGEDPGWERISWDEAVKMVVQGIETCQEKYGNPTFFGMSGTSRVWSMGGYSALPAIFDSPNAIRADQICKGPRYWASKINDCWSWYWMETVGRPRVYVQWGGASELSNYDDSCRTTVDVATRADKHIIVDPRQTNLGKEADIWVNLRPGTDGAVANCWAQVIIENDLIDDLYVRRWMNAPMLVVEEESFEPTPCSSSLQSASIKTRLLKESDIKEGGSDTRFMVVNELTGNLSWYDASLDTPGWEGEDWKPMTEGTTPHQPGLDATGQSQGFLPNRSQFPEGLYPALFTEEGGREVELKDGTKVHVRTVWERYIEFLEDYTPEKVEEISGVKADVLREAAITYATPVDPATGYGNGGIQYMLAAEHACNALQNQRACDLLVGITGNMDVPGGQRGGTLAWDGMMDICTSIPFGAMAMKQFKYKDDGSLLLGSERFPLIGSDCSEGYADATSVYDAIETGSPYKVSCGAGSAGDFMNQSNSLNAYEQLKKLDFWCSIDLWHTPMVDGIADVVLPAAHWLEMDCLRKSQGGAGALGATVKCIESPGEAKPDQEILMRLAKENGTPWLPGATPDEMWPVDNALYAVNSFVLSMGFRIKDWEEYKKEFQEKGWFDLKVENPDHWGSYRRYETGNVDFAAKNPGWRTTTHKQEIWSTVLESWLINGVHNDGKPVKLPDSDEEFQQNEVFPVFREAPHSPVADPDAYKDDNAFLMTTGRRQGTYFHSEHRQLPWCRELWPVPRLEINPQDAERLGIEQGDWVWIETEHGKIREVADLYYGIAPGVVNAEHQWWYPEAKQPDRGFKLSGVNCLVDRHAQDRIIGSSNLRAYAVKVYKATPENSPFGNPVPCMDDGTEVIHTSDDPRLKDWMPVYERSGE